MPFDYVTANEPQPTGIGPSHGQLCGSYSAVKWEDNVLFISVHCSSTTEVEIHLALHQNRNTGQMPAGCISDAGVQNQQL